MQNCNQNFELSLGPEIFFILFSSRLCPLKTFWSRNIKLYSSSRQELIFHLLIMDWEPYYEKVVNFEVFRMIFRSFCYHSLIVTVVFWPDSQLHIYQHLNWGGLR